MSWHHASVWDDPPFNPEPLEDEPELPPEAGDCPDCKVGVIIMHVGCDRCGLTWDDLTAAAEMIARLEGTL